MELGKILLRQKELSARVQKCERSDWQHIQSFTAFPRPLYPMPKTMRDTPMSSCDAFRVAFTVRVSVSVRVRVYYTHISSLNNCTNKYLGKLSSLCVIAGFNIVNAKYWKCNMQQQQWALPATLTNSLKREQGVVNFKIKVPKYVLFAVELLGRWPQYNEMKKYYNCITWWMAVGVNDTYGEEFVICQD